MNAGTTISGIGHAGLILWVLLGDFFFAPDDLAPPMVTEVSLITGEEFAQLAAAVPAPAVEPTPQPEPPPEPVAEPEALPETPVVPQPVAEPEPLPTVEPDAVTLVPAAPPRSRPRPAEIVSPEPVEAPPEDVEIADTQTPAVTPDAAPEAAVVEEEAAATAPPESSTVLETEANQDDAGEPVEPPPEEVPPEETPPEEIPEVVPEVVASAAPTTSARPRARPEPVEPTEVAAVEPEPTPEPATEPTPEVTDQAAIEAALADVLGAEEPSTGQDAETAPQAPSGPPMTSGEKDGLRVAVQKCWNVGSLSTDALNVTVTIAVSMQQDGRPETGSIKMIGFEGGSETGAKQAFEAGRRAIIRCGADGFPLPAEKYDQWKDIEMVFNPEGMRMR